MNKVTKEERKKWKIFSIKKQPLKIVNYFKIILKTSGIFKK